MKTIQLILPVVALSGALFFSSCAEDPSQNVPSADVTEVEETETPETTSDPAPPAAEAETNAGTAPPAPPAAETETPAEAAPPEPAASAESVAYAFTDESKIGFIGSKVTGSHEGGFEKFSGSFQVAGDEPGQGPHHIEIDTTSVWSDNEKLTGHLKSPDFFNVEKFPTSKFTLNSLDPADGDDMYTLSGELELHGTKKTISFPAKITKGEEKVHLDAEFSINRKDFGINYEGKADDLIRDGVVIKLAMVATKQ